MIVLKLALVNKVVLLARDARLTGIVVLALTLLLNPKWSLASSDPYILDTNTFGHVTLQSLVQIASTKGIILFGEDHFSEDDHRAQFTFLRALKEKGLKLAVAHEALPFSAQPTLDRYYKLQANDEDLFREYSKISSPVFFKSIAPIFRYCQANSIPIIGLRAETPVLYKLFNKGYSSLSEEELNKLPGYDPSCRVPARYKNFMNMFAETTIPFAYIGPKDPNTCQFYMGLDSVMANKLGAYAELNKDVVVVAFTGALHAWKHGIPSHLGKYTNRPVMIIFPSTEKERNIGYNISSEDADFVWWHF